MSCVTRTSLGSTLSPEMDGGTVTTKKTFQSDVKRVETDRGQSVKERFSLTQDQDCVRSAVLSSRAHCETGVCPRILGAQSQ